MDKPKNCGPCRHFHNMVHTWCVRFPPQPLVNCKVYYPTVSCCWRVTQDFPSRKGWQLI